MKYLRAPGTLLISTTLFLSSLCGLEGATPADLQIGVNFTGSTFGPDSDASPADADGAIGPQHYVEFINGRFSVYEKATGNRVQTKTDLQFWNASGVTFSSTVGATDPRMIYDPLSQRWFASMVDFTVNRPAQRSNHFLLAVSATSDPTGKWHGFSFNSDTNRVDFADFPTLGVDGAGVYLSGNMFDRLGNPVGPTLVAIPKEDLLAPLPTIANRTSFGIMSYTSRGNVDQPAVTTGVAHSPELVVAVGDVGVDFQPHTTLVLSSISFATNGTALLSSPAVILDVPAYTVPINPPQPDGSNNLDNGDARFSACVRRVGDVAYATHAVEVNDRAAVRWYVINATNYTLIQSGTIADPNLNLFYPSIAANEAGTVVIACNGSSLTQFVSSYAAVGRTTNGVVTFGKPALLQSGTASYQNVDPTDPAGTSRWGDYSATTVDPIDPTRFWTIQMIPVRPSAWATQITEILTAPAPVGPLLSAQQVGANLVLSWPAGTAGVQLQTSPTLAPEPAWSLVLQSPETINNLEQVVVSITNGAAFFRLGPVSGL